MTFVSNTAKKFRVDSFRKLICVLGALVATDATAQEFSGWSCRNTDAEIQCGDGKCEILGPENYTPMSISIFPDNISVCAYSGCWEGEPMIVEDSKTVYALGRDLKWSHDDSAKSAIFQIAITKDTNVGILLGESWAHPVHCEPTKFSEGRK